MKKQRRFLLSAAILMGLHVLYMLAANVRSFSALWGDHTVPPLGLSPWLLLLSLVGSAVLAVGFFLLWLRHRGECIAAVGAFAMAGALMVTYLSEMIEIDWQFTQASIPVTIQFALYTILLAIYGLSLLRVLPRRLLLPCGIGFLLVDLVFNLIIFHPSLFVYMNEGAWQYVANTLLYTALQSLSGVSLLLMGIGMNRKEKE